MSDANKANGVEWSTLACVAGTLILAVVSYRTFERQLGVLQAANEQEERDFRSQSTLQVEGRILYPIDHDGPYEAKLAAVQLLLRNIRRRAVVIDNIEFTISVRDPDAKLAAWFPERSTLVYMPELRAEEDPAAAPAAPDPPAPNLSAEEMPEPSPTVSNLKEFLRAEIFAVNKPPGAQVEFLEVLADKPLKVVRKPTSPELLGAQERSVDLELLILHPASPQIIEVDATVHRKDGKTSKWTRWFGIGGFPSRVVGDPEYSPFEPAPEAAPEAPSSAGEPSAGGL